MREINMETWNRKELFAFFSNFNEPFFGVTLIVDFTIAYSKAKLMNKSFFLYYLYRATKAASEIENFRYRIIGEKVFEFGSVHASPTISRDDGTFGFAHFDYTDNEQLFVEKATFEISKVKRSKKLFPDRASDNIIHFSTLPWLSFTSLTHARNFANPDSCPKISFGMMMEVEGIKKMPIAIYGHHGLIDGYHISLFVQRFQELLNE